MNAAQSLAPSAARVPGFLPTPESEHALYQVSLQNFAGPMDLLVFLIRHHRLDVFDIPIAFICAQYQKHLEVLAELNVDVAAEFLVLAADLLHIKSRLLLPRPVDVPGEEEDPRADLVRRILEYQKYRQAAQALAERARLGRDVFQRDAVASEVAVETQVPLRELGVFALVEAFDAVLRRTSVTLRHAVFLEQVSVAQRMRTLVDALAPAAELPLTLLLGPLASRMDVVVTFLALLELARLRLISILTTPLGAIYLSPRYRDAAEAAASLSHLGAH